MAKIRNTNMATPMIPPRLPTEERRVEMRILMEGIPRRSLRGLMSLTDLRVFIPPPPP